MPTQKKADTVEELRDKFTRCTIAVATDYTGIDGNTMTESAAPDAGQEYRIHGCEKYPDIPGSRLRRQAPDKRHRTTAQRPWPSDMKTLLDVAKALEEYIRVNRSVLAIKGGVLNDRTLSPGEMTSLATLPPKPDLLALLMGQMQAPLSGLMGQLQAPIQGLVTVLNGPVASLSILLQQRAEQLRSQEG